MCYFQCAPDRRAANKARRKASVLFESFPVSTTFTRFVARGPSCGKLARNARAPTTFVRQPLRRCVSRGASLLRIYLDYVEGAAAFFSSFLFPNLPRTPTLGRAAAVCRLAAPQVADHRVRRKSSAYRYRLRLLATCLLSFVSVKRAQLPIFFSIRARVTV